MPRTKSLRERGRPLSAPLAKVRSDQGVSFALAFDGWLVLTEEIPLLHETPVTISAPVSGCTVLSHMATSSLVITH